ncbi:MAG TPA: DUF481 domain-containing protein [Lacipirellulaceae bacterium]|nr:DUF481 domain-containing protein [Lacipirellulaceae bacterium]
MRICRTIELALALAIGGALAAAVAPAGAQPALLPPPSAASAAGAMPPPVPPAAGAASPAYGAPSTGEFDSLLPPLVEPLTSPAPLAESMAAESMQAAITPTPHWYHPHYWLGEDPWTAGVELGINGSEGNNHVFSMRSGGHLKRETRRWKFDSSLSYNKNHSNGAETQNNGKLDARADRTIADSRWTLFLLENLIYDEFQAFDIQLSLNGGVGYKWIDSETIDLLTRFGAGATREYGGLDNDWQPTALFGVDYEHQLTKMQRAVAKVDYFPEWEDYRQYRVVTDLGWQIDLDRPKNVSIKLSVTDRYDSTPDGAEPNNLDYSVLLIWGI